MTKAVQPLALSLPCGCRGVSWVGMEIPKPPSPNTQGEELAILLALISGNLYVFDRKPVLCLSGFCCSAEKASYTGTKDSTAYY